MVQRHCRRAAGSRVRVRRGFALGLVAPVAAALMSLIPLGTVDATAAAVPAMSLTPIADTFVYAQQPTVNYGSKTFMDVYGGTQKSCTAASPQAYGLMKFDLSSIPAGATVTGASLKMTTRAGNAQGGDENDHLLRLPDTSWTESGVTWLNRPLDGTVAPGNPLMAPVPPATVGIDVRKSRNALGSASVQRNCGQDDGNTETQVKEFPTNGYLGATGQSMSRDEAEANFVAAIADARANAGGLLSLELYTPMTADGLSYWARYNTREAGDPAVRPKLVLSFASAVIVQAVSNATDGAVTVRVAGQPATTYSVSVLTSNECIDGRLSNPTLVGTLTATTDGTGTAYVSGTVSALSTFVAATLSGATGELTAPLACVRSGPDNDAWTRAMPIGLAGGGPVVGSIDGYVDRAGGSRWFRFSVQPASRVRVDLKNLPADFDLALFRDIAQTYNTLTSNADLTRVSAEFSPSAFSPSAFSPSAFSPSAFSPDDYSPSAFSPSAFSPDAFSPSAFSPSAFSPSAFSPAAFTSAQTRSLVAVSYTTGTSDEAVVADTWNNSGSYYARVSGRNGAFSTTAPFSLAVSRDDRPACTGVAGNTEAPTPAPGQGYQTVILLDSARQGLQPGNPGADIAALTNKLATFAARPEVQGAIVDVASNGRVQALNAQAEAHRGCPYAKNLVAGAIKDIVSSYRVSNPLKYVVLVGPDGTIPFFRYPDEGLLGPESDYVPPVDAQSTSEASLRLNYVLGQDEYGSSATLAVGAATFPVPDLAVGRLIETASEASGMLDAYSSLTGGVAPAPRKALVTGYDFLADAANTVADDLVSGMGNASAVNRDLIAPNNISPLDSRAWTADALRAKLFGSRTATPVRNDLVFLAGHFSANSALAADFATSVLSTELGDAANDFTNTVVFSAGCHSGYNIVDGDAVPGITATVDWAQAFARRKATLIAGTGYQYGDTDFVDYSERIYTGFSRQLRYGSGPVAVGQALVRSKLTYLTQTPDPRGLHRKALLESALFGLPMLSVNMPSGRLAAPPAVSIIGATTPFTTNPGLTLGLTSADTTISGALTPHTVALKEIGTGATVNATYYSGPDGVVSNIAEPTLPLISKSVAVTGKVLRGVGFRGGAYTDTTPIVPLTGAATTELREAHVPFLSPVFFPMRVATANYYDALAGGDTRVLLTPVQHRTDPGTDQTTLRLFNNVDLRLFYSAFDTNFVQPALSAAPSINGVSGAAEGGDFVFRATVTGNPAAGIQQVWATYTGDGPSRWASADMVQCVITPPLSTLPLGCARDDSSLWVGRLVGGAAAGANLRFMMQAANGVGLVAMDDAVGEYYSPLSGAPRNATLLQFSIHPGSAVYGSRVPVSAVLTSLGSPVAGKPVSFTIGSSTRTVFTDGSGVATAFVAATAVPGQSSLRAWFAGDVGTSPSAASAPLTVDKSPTALSIAVTPQAGTVGPGVIATLRSGAGVALVQSTVYVSINGANAQKLVPVITDFLGRATLAPLPVPVGTYTVTAQFLGIIPLPTPTELTDRTYLPSSASATATVRAVADVGVTALAAPSPAVVGDPLTFSFTVTNNGPDTASNITLTDVLPPTFTSPATPSPECAIANARMTCTFATIPSGSTTTVTLTGRPSAVGSLSTTVTVAGESIDTNPGNDSASATVTVGASVLAPTSVTVSGPTTVLSGTVYNAATTSNGTAPLTYALVRSSTTPTWLSVNTSTGAISGAVPMTYSGSFTYAVSATNTAGSKTSATVGVTVVPLADLGIDSKAPGLFVGVPTTYSLIVSNLSTFASGVVTVTDNLPADLSYAGYSGTGWTCSASGTLVTCTLSPSLAAKSTTSLKINVNVTAPVKSVITNTVNVSPIDSNPANNKVIITSTVQR